MDLKDLDVAKFAGEGFELALLNPKTQADTGLRITVLGRDSDIFRRLDSEQNRKRLAKMTKSGTVRFNSLSTEELEADAIELMAVCTVRWSEVPTENGGDEGLPKDSWEVDGEELACNRSNVIKVYKRFAWIREQVDAAISDRANFIKG